MSLAAASVPIIVSNSVGVMADGASDALIPLLVGVIFAVGAGIWLLNWMRRQLSTEFIADTILAMRKDAFAAAARQDLSFYDEFSSGRIVSRITSDTQEFGEVIILTTDVINQLGVAIVLLITLFTIEWKLSLLVLVMAPFVALAALSFRRLARRVTRQSTRAVGEVNKSIQEAITGISVAKNFRQEQAIYNEFETINQQSYVINVRRGFVMSNIFPVLNVLGGVGTALLIYIGGQSALAGAITIAAWYLFVATVDRFWFPITNLSAFWSQFQQGAGGCRTSICVDGCGIGRYSNRQPICKPTRRRNHL